MSWYSKEADNTYIIFGGILIALLVIFGLIFVRNDILSEGIAMAFVAMPVQFISFAIGKKVGQLEERTKKDDS